MLQLDSNSNKVIAIDIGNTRTHVALVYQDIPRCEEMVAFSSKSLVSDLIPAIDGILKRQKLTSTPQLIISSVIKSLLNEIYKQLCLKYGHCTIFEYHENLPVKIYYADPYKLGTDRIADALYARTMYPLENVIIINAGTAIKVDLVQRGEFKGGTIFPGIDAQFQVMHQSTDALPHLQSGGTVMLPGRSTEECMRAGVILGAAGAVNHIVKRYSSEMSILPVILATGGAWPILSEQVEFKFINVPDMTILGVSMFR